MSNYNTKIKKLQEPEIPKNLKYKFVKMVKSRDLIDVTKLSWKPKANIKKLSKSHYMKGYYMTNGEFVSDGEVFEIMEKTSHMRNRRSLRKIFTDLRQLIYTNFEGAENEVFLTLTYAEQTNDPKRIHVDLKCFWQKLQRRYPNSELGYIAIVEPHASGNFHIHMLLQAVDGSTPWTADPDDLGRELYGVWGHGYVLVEHLDCSNIGAYFVAYFSNMELTTPEQLAEYADDVVEKNGKKYVKGARLDFYPDYMKIYRNSRNMKKPVTAPTDLTACEKVYSSTSELSDDDGRTMYVTKEQYKEVL